MAPSLLANHGAQPAEPSRFTPIHVSKALHGEITNRFALHDPSAFITERFYGGYQDCLLGGSNVEISPRNTWWRRPGNSLYTSFVFPSPPLGAFGFNQNGVFTTYVDTLSNIYSVTPTSGTNVFTKGAGAGQASYLQLGSTLFVADGVDAIKIIGGKTWNWGIAAPTAAPSVQVVQSGVAAVPWTASTTYTTMGLIDDGTNIHQLISVNADGSNTANATIGTSGSGGPSWSHTPGQTTTESSGTPITWKNFGPIVAWTPNTTYNNAAASVGGTTANPCIVYDPVTQACYINGAPGLAQGTSGPTRPNFTPVTGTYVWDGGTTTFWGQQVGGAKWYYVGPPNTPGQWKKSTAYLQYGVNANNTAASSICEPTTPQAAGIGGTNPQTIYFQVATNGGTSGTGGTTPKWATSAGTTDDGQLRWNFLGSRTWAANTPYIAWSNSGAPFSVIRDSNGNFQVAILKNGTSGTVSPGTVDTLTAASNASGGNTTYTGTFSPLIPVNATVLVAGFTNTGNNGTFPVVSCTATSLVLQNANGVAETHAATATVNPWGTTYQQTTTDNTVTWTCVGTATTWAASTKWYLPLIGFNPPTPTDPYGGADVIDSNNNVEFVFNSGLSGTGAPTWLGVGKQTTDNTITWYNNGPASTQSLAFTKGYAYCFAGKARAANDFYVTNIPNGRTSPNGPPTGSADGTIGPASPIFKMQPGSNAGAVMTISGPGFTDPQIDTIVVYRCADGFQGGPYLELTEFPNPALVNGNPGTWYFQDSFADTLLNPLIQADVIGLNSPPPTGLTNLAYHSGRVWGSVNNIVYASSGPQIPVGNGNGLTGWAPANNFPLTSPVTKILAPITGLLAFTTTDEWTISGGPAISQFFPTITRAGVGLLSPNAITSLGAEIILFTADRRLMAFIPGGGESNIGWMVQDQFQTYEPSKVYLTLHEAGIDRGLFLGNGSTSYKRVVLHSQPNNDIVWDTTATISGGCNMVQSIQTASGTRSLLIGAPGPFGGSPPGPQYTLLKRDLTTNTDNGAPYSANFIVAPGPICHDGEICEGGFLTFTGPRTGSAPTLSYLLNETNGTYQQFASYKSDPPLLYGDTKAPTSVYRNRHYFKQTMSDGNPPPSVWFTDILIQCAFVAENAANEMARFTIYGGIYKDPND